MDPDLWDAVAHNPVSFLGQIRQDRLLELAKDSGFLAHLERANRYLQSYLQDKTWFQKEVVPQGREADCYAYFSAEFGLTDCLPIYSGGLGVLAGDHLKAASDLGLPLVGVGLLYQKGYFRQYLNSDGWQQERYPVNDFYNMPLELMRQADGSEIRITVNYPGRDVYARIWRSHVGRVPLYLLDTNIFPNSQYDQDICDELYGGDQDLRIHQEMMLGIGGVRALQALQISPTVFHMNEGHSAFLAVERIRIMMSEKQLTFAEALQVARSSQIFTTHTPVPAGIDLFPPDKVDYYMGNYYAALGLHREEFLALGRENTGDFQAPFSMAVLAINTASFVNGVSRLHGAVSRRMFSGLWQEVPETEVPIQSVTNGAHVRTWVGEDNQHLYDRYLGPEWSDAPPTSPLWQRLDVIPDSELWRTHERSRNRLVHFTRQRLYEQLQRREASRAEIDQAHEVLHPEILTIGFARRFATYKRASLILKDLERLSRILNHPDRPVQIIFAGKAHPRDNPGKELIREIVQVARQPEFRSRIVFIEDYDMYVTSLMVAGADIWLNNPLRPREASGTSGIKSSMNGGLNLSILDGWWDEADYHQTGWPIGRGEEYTDRAYQDQVESNAIYNLLEQEIAPIFYTRGQDGLPRTWIQRMKTTIRLNAPQFSAERMVKEYAERAYFRISDYHRRMQRDQFQAARSFTHWQQQLLEHWYEVQVINVEIRDHNNSLLTPEGDGEQGPVLKAHDPLTVNARIRLHGLKPQDLLVQVYLGAVNEEGDILEGRAMPLTFMQEQDQLALFSGHVHYDDSGLQGLALRLLPHHPDLNDPLELRLMRWA
jgi:starch phosphorylase